MKHYEHVVWLLLLLLILGLLHLDFFRSPQFILFIFASHLSISNHYTRCYIDDIQLACLKLVMTFIALKIRLWILSQDYKPPNSSLPTPNSEPRLALPSPCSVCFHHTDLYIPQACQLLPIFLAHRPFYLHINAPPHHT